MPQIGISIHMQISSMNQMVLAPYALKKIRETPVRPLMTTCVVDIGSAKIRTLTRIKAEHICVEPRTMNPRRKLSMSLNLMVYVIVCTRV